MTATTASVWPGRWQRFSAACVQGFHTYSSWLVSISWRRFVVLSVLLMLVLAILQSLPPFSWHWHYTVRNAPSRRVVVNPPAPPATPARPGASAPASGLPEAALKKLEKLEKLRQLGHSVEIHIDDKGIRITPKAGATASAGASAGAASPAASAASGADNMAASPATPRPLVDIQLPAGADTQAIREAVEEARRDLEEAIRDAQRDVEDAARDMAQAQRDVAQAQRDAVEATHQVVQQIGGLTITDGEPELRDWTLGEFLPPLGMLWIVASIIIKITYKKQIQAEAQAAQAVETAEAESLRRQVVEARMAAMQAQVEPHFLFNTLASIDHLIEVDPQRASQMQKNLIALLRASMPTMREASSDGVRDLGRELAVIRPYLEILKVRMEERLSTRIDVPDGLLSAEFPPMMVQTLVENAIKHGLEPKPEGGALSVAAEIVHGKLAVTVADTGLGFGRAATAGTGVGLANIRERLQMLYGTKASLTITENPGGGTRVVIAVPYKPVQGAPS